MKFVSNIAAVLQESALFGNGPVLSAATRKLSKFSEGSNTSRDFWSFADLPVAPWMILSVCPKNK